MKHVPTLSTGAGSGAAHGTVAVIVSAESCSAPRHVRKKIAPCPQRFATIFDPTTESTVSVLTENLGTMESPTASVIDSRAPDDTATTPPAPATAPPPTNAARTTAVLMAAFTRRT